MFQANLLLMTILIEMILVLTNLNRDVSSAILNIILGRSERCLGKILAKRGSTYSAFNAHTRIDILIYINDVTDGLKCNVKLFADDTSIFTVVHDPNAAAVDMNHDLNLINLWARKWRMSFNPDPTKQAVEVTFSKKRSPVNHPPIFFNEAPVKNVPEQRHLGIILDSKLSFASHIKTVISKSRQGIGMLRFLSKYLPRHTLNEMYKLYVRPHLDYTPPQ